MENSNRLEITVLIKEKKIVEKKCNFDQICRAELGVFDKEEDATERIIIFYGPTNREGRRASEGN